MKKVSKKELFDVMLRNVIEDDGIESVEFGVQYMEGSRNLYIWLDYREFDENIFDSRFFYMITKYSEIVDDQCDDISCGGDYRMFQVVVKPN